MNSHENELISILNKQLNTQDELIQTAENLNNFIKEKDVNGVHRETRRFDELIYQSEAFEEKRLDVCDKISESHGINKRHLTLRNIISIVENEKSKDLKIIHNSLKEKINLLSKLNTSNIILLEESLLNVAYRFNLISQSHEKLSGYNRNGNKQNGSSNRSIFNHKA